MKNSTFFAVSCFLAMQLLMPAPAEGIEQEYKVNFEQWLQAKAFYDDPRPVYRDYSWEIILPPDEYALLTYSTDSMQKEWADLVGFKAPAAVGRIAPEIRPGTYTWQDKEKNPGLKELMWPLMYDRFNPGAPPFCGNFPVIEVVPTRQYYLSLPVCRASTAHRGKTSQDDQGYLLESTYTAGVPFPQPAGRFKAQQIAYNCLKRYLYPENFYSIQCAKGYANDLREDYSSKAAFWRLQLHGRVAIPPYGWYDRQAEEKGEITTMLMKNLSPRDMFGNLITITRYLGWKDYDQFLVYVAQLRRVRKISGTDTQDTAAGLDLIYEDAEGWSQKLTPYLNPYDFRLLAEREYLVPACSIDGAEYLQEKNLEWRNLKFERRPCYVLELTQLDPGYVYKKRILYIDRETFILLGVENYDRQGRLYRTLWPVYGWMPESGYFRGHQILMLDHVDQHSTFLTNYTIPAPWITRRHLNMLQLIKEGK
jgi:hypothetical protein